MIVITTVKKQQLKLYIIFINYYGINTVDCHLFFSLHSENDTLASVSTRSLFKGSREVLTLGL